MDNLIKLLICFTALVFVEIFAEISLTKSVKTNKPNLWFTIGIFLYILVAILFWFCLKLKNGKLSILNIIWQAANIVIVAILGFLIFKEKLNLFQILGLILVVIGSIMVGMKKE